MPPFQASGIPRPRPEQPIPGSSVPAGNARLPGHPDNPGDDRIGDRWERSWSNRVLLLASTEPELCGGAERQELDGRTLRLSRPERDNLPMREAIDAFKIHDKFDNMHFITGVLPDTVDEWDVLFRSLAILVCFTTRITVPRKLELQNHWSPSLSNTGKLLP